MVRLIIAFILLATCLLPPAAMAKSGHGQKSARVHQKKHSANKISYYPSKDNALSMTKEERQIMDDRNKADGQPPRTRKTSKKRPESAYDKTVKSVDEYIYGKRPKQEN